MFVLVCTFCINCGGKNGGDYVMVIFTLVVLIWGILCVASKFSSAGNICLLESDWLVCLSGVNFLRTRIV